MSKISAYAALTLPAAGDVLPVVDVSDTSMAASGTTKKITIANLVPGVTLSPSGDTTGATDTAAIQALENSGAETIYFATGTFWTAGLVKKSNVSWLGAGRGATVIKLASAVNAPVLVSDQFAALTLSGSNTSGVTGFAIRDLVFDGNASAQTVSAAAGVQIFGYDYLLDNISVRNFKATDGLYTEWGIAGIPAPEGAMESHIRMLRVHGNTLTGAGWHNRGPHDLHVFGAFIYNNTVNAHGYWAESTGGAYTASGLSGTAVSSTPATITLATTLSLPAAGTVTMTSAGGTVTITYTGSTATTLTGCSASGGSGNYTSNTVTPPGYAGTAAVITAMHAWGSHEIGYVLDCETHLTGCQAEGANIGQVLVRAGNCTWTGGKVFYPSGSSNPGYGFQLGDTANQCSAFGMNMPLLTGFAGGAAATAAINVVSTASGQYRATIFQASGQAVYGTFQPYELRKFSWGGTTTPTIAAAGGAGTSPPAPTVSNGSDNRGAANWGTGTSPATGSQVTVTYAQPKPGTPTVIISPGNSATAALQPYIINSSSTGFTIGTAVAPLASQIANFYSVAYADGTG